MEYFDRVADRVSLCVVTGLVAGAAHATYTGLPLRATSLKTAGSCAIVGTALFGAERLAYAALKDRLNNERQLVLTSHAFAGVMGGGLNGYVYQKKPLRGMFFLLPAMLAVGYLELAWEQHIKTRREELNMAAETFVGENTGRDER